MHFTKKIRYFIDTKIATYIFKYYPMFVNFLHGFVDFLDQECASDMINFTNNLDTETMYDKFVQSYFEQFCKNSVDEKRFVISRKIKKTLINIAKMWYKTKGRMFSIDILLKYIGNYYVSSSGEYIGEVNYNIEENPAYWLSNGIFPYSKPYTYTLTGDVPISDIKYILKSVNPLGYSAEFNISFDITDILKVGGTYRETFERLVSNHIAYTETINPSKLNERFAIEGKNQEVFLEEVFNIYPRYFRYDGLYKFDGHLDGANTTSHYDAIDKGVYEDYEFQVYKNNILIEDIKYRFNGE